MLLVSCDSKYLFTTNGSHIDVFSNTSGELVYRLTYTENSNNTKEINKISKKNSKSLSTPLTHQAHENESVIKSICINTSNKYQLLSFHLGGRTCLWDYEDGLLLKTFETRLLIKKLIRTETNLYCVGKLREEFMKNDTTESERGQLCLYKLIIDDSLKSHSEVVKHQLLVSNLNVNDEKLIIAIDNEAKYVAYVEGRKYLVINQFRKNTSNSSNMLNKLRSKLELTCLTIHPNEDCIATGTASGKIILWYNYLQSASESSEMDSEMNKNAAKKATKSILHWHSLPVLSLCFTPEGSYLLSGGHECVLVKWMYRTGQAEFKPRLGAPINEIVLANDNTLYATKHVDNTIHLIGTNLNVQQTFCGFLRPKLVAPKSKGSIEDTLYPTGLNHFTQLNCLITNGKPGHLQFYSYQSDMLLFNLDIVEENYISPENLNRPNIHTEIECLAFNHDSTWLATCERRDDHVTTPETRLKFWRFDQTNNKFSLNTLVRFPHAFEKVNEMKFNPKTNTLFTCGADGCFKSWILKENRVQASPDTPTPEITFNWIYNSCDGYRDLKPTKIDFLSLPGRPTHGKTTSSDADLDLIAVSFNHIVTIWLCDEYGVVFLSDLIHCDPSDFIQSVHFMNEGSEGSEEGSNKLLVSHTNCLNLWSIDLPTGSTESESDGSLAPIDLKMKFSCVWSEEIDEVISVTQNPDKDENELIIFNKKTQKQINEETLTEIQVMTFNMLKKTKLPTLKVIHTFNVYSDSQLHFLLIKKSESEKSNHLEGQENKDSEFENLLKSVNIFYCDNRGVLQKVLYKSMSTKTDPNEETDVDLNDFMWNSRKALKKNLPESNLASIIDLHKSNKWSKDINHFIDNEKNALFDSNMNKIETTPAYLLPKVNTFCYDLLKSMLHHFDQPADNNTKTNKNKKSINNNQNGNQSMSEEDLSASSSEEEEEGEEGEGGDEEGMEVDSHENNSSKAQQNGLLINENGKNKNSKKKLTN